WKAELMPQPDCGCNDLVTPTLGDLLAVAHSKPLPRVSVRERRPPPARVAASMKGWIEWRLINRAGKEVRGGKGPNLILDQGLDQVATQQLRIETISIPTGGGFPIIGYCAVGTDSSSPATSQTALGAEVARTATRYADDEIGRSGPGV